LDTSGNLIWNSFLGGSGYGYDWGYSVAVDGSGNIFVEGTSNATWGSPINPKSGGTGTFGAYVAKLDSSGNLTWNTFISGNGNVTSGFGHSLALDGGGNMCA